MVKSSRFWDRAARKYAAAPIADMTAYDYTLGRMRERLRPTDRVLEIGCGTASTALQLAPSVGHYLATDYSAAMVEIGRAKCAEAGLSNLEVAQASLDDGRLPGGQFDVILALNMLHLADDPAAAIAQIRDRLAPGGLFISKTACLCGPWRLMWPAVSLMRAIGKAPPVHFFSPGWLEGTVRAAGFDILESGDFPKRPPRRFIVARRR
ncbi:class I SAM-dependent methyltransferase [Albidovulum sediminicola]|uniref:Class I SAM-dependent methyltransferase n=1 Tax=Albidovulum sediminicola TaxID=2984331 RepID=A0ABT2Z1Q8_9RHOB|nr:class I SAM-dependent methyltransferase [Defluviimonas sp. WL0075]MCV2864970.1 class I SAM-dependent methyltransferase [Defluviimonas sp. WL0075]